MVYFGDLLGWCLINKTLTASRWDGFFWWLVGLGWCLVDKTLTASRSNDLGDSDSLGRVTASLVKLWQCLVGMVSLVTRWVELVPRWHLSFDSVSFGWLLWWLGRFCWCLDDETMTVSRQDSFFGDSLVGLGYCLVDKLTVSRLDGFFWWLDRLG